LGLVGYESCIHFPFFTMSDAPYFLGFGDLRRKFWNLDYDARHKKYKKRIEKLVKLEKKYSELMRFCPCPAYHTRMRDKLTRIERRICKLHCEILQLGYLGSHYAENGDADCARLAVSENGD
jgi:hypothetical protein